jgi:hypothetical protein
MCSRFALDRDRTRLGLRRAVRSLRAFSSPQVQHFSRVPSIPPRAALIFSWKKTLAGNYQERHIDESRVAALRLARVGIPAVLMQGQVDIDCGSSGFEAEFECITVDGMANALPGAR